MIRALSAMSCSGLLGLLVALFAIQNVQALYNSSFVAARGYANPGGKLWIQWGRNVTNSDSSQRFTFAKPFGTACVYVGVNPLGFPFPPPAFGAPEICERAQLSASSFDTTGFYINRDDAFDGSPDFTWIAIGYDADWPNNQTGIDNPETSFLLNATRGYAKLNSLLLQWGQITSTRNSPEMFELSAPIASIQHLAHVGLNLRASNTKTPLWVWYAMNLNPKPVFFVDRYGTNFDTTQVDCSFVGVGRNIGPGNSTWDYQSFDARSVVVNMGGLWLQSGFRIYNHASKNVIAFNEPFPTAVYHVGINPYGSSPTPWQSKSVTGFNTTHFWLPEACGTDAELPYMYLSFLAIGH